MDLNSKLVEKIKSTDNAITDVQSTAMHVTQYTLFVCVRVCTAGIYYYSKAGLG